MKLQKELGLLAIAVCLTGCMGTSDSSSIATSRGLNSSMVGESEFKQYQIQRANEVSEANAQAAKNHAALSSARETMGTVQQAVDVIRDIKNFFH